MFEETTHDAQIVTQKANETSTHDWKEKFWQDRQLAETDRVKQWREKQAKENIPITYEMQAHDLEQDKVFLKSAVNKSRTTIEDEFALKESVLCAAFGTASSIYNNKMLNQTLNAQFMNKDEWAQKANGTIESLVAMNPKDVIEGHLCSRLTILVDQYNEYMRRTTFPNQPVEIIERYLNCATKLMRVYNETLESLNKHRRKGEQKVTVQYVNVNGGQAVVAGQFNQQRDGVSDQKAKE
ncbi:MAG TPA: hypothetical protein VGW78_00055 [Candidatus Babeliales bacterium]|nr:hypothetical protein [Candidatus Babeliales bacterium]